MEQRLISVIPDRVFRIDADMRYVEYYGLEQDLIGSRTDLLGKTVREVLTPELASRVENAIHEALETQQPVHLEYDLSFGGEPRSFRATVSPGSDHEVVVVSRDCTDLKRDRDLLQLGFADLERRVAERTGELQQVNSSLIALLEHRRVAELALQERYAHLQTLVDRAPAAIIELDRSGRVISWSRSAEQMFGWTAAEAIGLYNPTVPENDLQESRSLLAAILNGNNVDSLPVVRQTRDGKRLHVAVSTAAIRRGDGKIEHFILVYNRLPEDIGVDLEALTRRMRELSALSRSITRSLSLNEAMQTVSRELARLFGICSGVLLLVAEDELETRFTWGAAFEGAARAKAVWDDEIGFVTDPATGRQWLRAPLFDTDHKAGVLILEAPSKRDGDLNLLREIARELTAAVTNARLFEELRRANQRLQELSRRLVIVQENERRHLGRELHDQIGQMLTGLKLSLSAARKESPNDSLAYSEGLIGDLLNKVRTLSLELRPPMLDAAGLIPALDWLVGQYGERTGTQVDFRHGEIGRLDSDVETAAFRIVQEAMTNAVRHGDARHIVLRVWRPADRLFIQVEDDGVGFASASAPLSTAGLTGMRERAEFVGGSLSIASTPSIGTCVSVDLPLSGQSNSHGDSHHRG